LIPEFRLDHSSVPLFVNKTGGSTQTAANVLVAAVFSF
jgi:hypothetical protein